MLSVDDNDRHMDAGGRQREGVLITLMLKVISAMLGRNINDHIHLIFSHDPLAARPISILHKNDYQPLKTKINGMPTNHDKGWELWGFALPS